MIKYILKNKPRLFILENVSGLMSRRHKKTLDKLLKRISKEKRRNGSRYYNIRHKLLNTNEYGIPQNRPRVYIVGISAEHETDVEFTWPEQLPCRGAKQIGYMIDSISFAICVQMFMVFEIM